MTLKELLDGVRVLRAGTDLEREIGSFTCDSRKAETDGVFIAVKGVKTDAHAFVPEMLSKGVLCIVENEQWAAEGTVLVPDTREAYALMAANWYGKPGKQLRLVGITGTNGKTTTTLLIKHILEQMGHKVGLIGTIENRIGDRVVETASTTPEPMELQGLFRQMVDEGCTYAVMEVSSHSLDQRRVAGCYFEVGIFSNLTQDHLDYHITMENYLRAKARLFRMCRKGVINCDDAAAAELLSYATSDNITYAIGSEADLRATDVQLLNDGVHFTATWQGESLPVALQIPGRFSVYNALAAIGACLSLKLPFADAVKALASAAGVKGRMEVVPTGRDFSMLLDYAHTPDSLENALKTVRGFAKGRVVVLFGCGGDRDRTKRPIMGGIAAKLADFCIVTSDNPRTEEPRTILDNILAGMEGTSTPYVVIENRREAIRYAIEHARKDDVVLLAGKGHETYQILGTVKHHFDEREVIAEILTGA